MKKIIFALGLIATVSMTLVSCKKETTTPTATVTAPTVSNFELTLVSNKYTWAGSKTGFSQDSTNLCVIYKDTTSSKYILTILNENLSSDTSAILFQGELSSLSASNAITNALTYEVNKNIYFQSQVGSFVATLTNPTINPVVGTIYYGTLNGSAVGVSYSTSNSNSTQTELTSKISGKFSAVYIGNAEGVAIK